MPTVPDQQDYDPYQDYRDIEAAISAEKELTFAQCQWLLRQEDNTVMFAGDKWEQWYRYAVGHCPRFKKERPTR